MIRTLTSRVNPDGTPHYLYVAEDNEIALYTGKIEGELVVEDGTAYDVTNPFIGVLDHHHDALVHAIGDWYEENNHPDFPAGEFVHNREATQAALDARRALADPQMSLLSTTGQSLAINAVLAGIAYLGLNTASPGLTGANEYAGVTRQAATWTTSSAGSAGTNTAGLSWTTSGATPVPFAQGWSAVTAGNPILGFTLGASVQATTITAAAGAFSTSSS